MSLYTPFIPYFILAFLGCLLFTPQIKKMAVYFKIYDLPSPRKIHGTPIPRLGGLALFFPFIILVLWDLIVGHKFLPGEHLYTKHIFGVVIAASLILIIGIYDDIKRVSPYKKLFWQIVAASIVILAGIGIEYITNPFGGVIRLDIFEIPIIIKNNIPYYFTVLADLFTILWIILMVNTVNFLDGLDGLASGVSSIAFFILFFLSLGPTVMQQETALLCIILAGCTLGFLPYNFHPAKIFMGDSGSYFLGFMLAILAIISGGKVATALLILGLPILDAFWVILRRLLHSRSPFIADRKHLHHRLLDVGFSQRQAVGLIYLLSLCFGFIALFLESGKQKLIALLILIIIMFSLAVVLIGLNWRKKQQVK